MIRWLGLWRLVVGRVRSDWPFLLALWLLIASATTLLAGGALYAETVEVGGLRRALAEAPPEQRGVSVRFNASPAELVEVEDELRSVLDGAFGRAGSQSRLTLRSSSLRIMQQGASGEAGEPPERRLTLLGAYEALDEHAQLTGGSWPRPGGQPIEAAVSEGAAEALALEVGDRLLLADASRPGADPAHAVAEVVIVGIYLPEPDDPYWLGDRLELSGAEESGPALFRGPLMVSREDLLSGGFAQLDVRGRALPLLERMRVDSLDDVRAAIAALPRRVEAALPGGRFVTVERELGEELARIDRSALVSRSGVVLITLQFAVLAGYAVLLVGGILADRRRPEVALLRARGASTAEVGLIAAGEALVLSAPAVALGPLLGMLLVNGVGSWGAVGESGIIGAAQLSVPVTLVAVLAGLGCVVALTLPALLAEMDLARVRAALGRPLSQTLAQRLGLDLVLLAVAVIGILQLSTYGAPLTGRTGGTLELDPLLVAAPAMALAAGAVLVVRLVPRLGELAERLLRRGRGVLLTQATRQIARRPLRYTRSALLIVLAAALGTFGAMYGATWSQSQVDQAAHQAGADARVVLQPQGGTMGSQTGELLGAMPGVEAVSPIGRDFFDVGRALRRAELITVEPETLPAVLRGEHGLAAALAGLTASRPLPVGVVLPEGAQRLSLVLDADLVEVSRRPDFEPLVPEEWLGIRVSPLMSGGDTPATLDSQTAYFGGRGQRLVFRLSEAANATAMQPASLQGMIVEVSAPPSVVTGEIRLVSLEVSQSASGDADWQAVATPAQMTDWLMEMISGQSVTAQGSEQGGRLVWDREHPLTLDFSGPTQFRWASTGNTDLLLSAWANQPLLDRAGVEVGDDVNIDYQFQRVRLHIAGRLDDFPALDPGTPAALVDAATLDQLRFRFQSGPAEPDEWWLAVADARVEEVAAAALAEPIRAQTVITRLELTRTLLRDPIALGLVGALLLGSLAAAAFAGIGLLVNAVVSAREQLAELALLRALGSSGRHVLAWLTVEHGFVLGVGLLAGAGVGYLIGVLVLPHAPLNRSGARVVPSPEIVLPVELLLLVGLAGLAVVGLGVAIARREVGRRPLVDVLRERED